MSTFHDLRKHKLIKREAWLIPLELFAFPVSIGHSIFYVSHFHYTITITNYVIYDSFDQSPTLYQKKKIEDGKNSVSIMFQICLVIIFGLKSTFT